MVPDSEQLSAAGERLMFGLVRWNICGEVLTLWDDLRPAAAVKVEVNEGNIKYLLSRFSEEHLGLLHWRVI